MQRGETAPEPIVESGTRTRRNQMLEDEKRWGVGLAGRHRQHLGDPQRAGFSQPAKTLRLRGEQESISSPIRLGKHGAT
jgi:hypothetical protein